MHVDGCEKRLDAEAFKLNMSPAPFFLFICKVNILLTLCSLTIGETPRKQYLEHGNVK